MDDTVRPLDEEQKLQQQAASGVSHVSASFAAASGVPTAPAISANYAAIDESGGYIQQEPKQETAQSGDADAGISSGATTNSSESVDGGDLLDVDANISGDKPDGGLVRSSEDEAIDEDLVRVADQELSDSDSADLLAQDQDSDIEDESEPAQDFIDTEIVDSSDDNAPIGGAPAQEQVAGAVFSPTVAAAPSVAVDETDEADTEDSGFVGGEVMTNDQADANLVDTSDDDTATAPADAMTADTDATDVNEMIDSTFGDFNNGGSFDMGDGFNSGSDD